MKKPLRSLLFLLVFAAAAGGLIYSYFILHEERDVESTTEAPVVAPSRVTVTAAGAVVRLDVETQHRLGLRSAALSKASVADEVTASARMLDGTLLSAQLGEIRAAEAALTATRSDYERKRMLAEQGQNASVSAVEGAMAAMQRDEIAHSVARAKVVAVWGSALSARADLATLAEALLRREQAIARVELLATDRLDTPPENAVLERLDGFNAAGQLIGPAPMSENRLAGQCLLYLVGARAEQLVPGTMMIARLVRPGKESAGWLVPRSAVVRHGGLAWIYVKKDGETFARREVALDRGHADGWLVAEDIGMPVVVAGAQSLLSEELKGGIQMKG